MAGAARASAVLSIVARWASADTRAEATVLSTEVRVALTVLAVLWIAFSEESSPLHA